MKKLFFILLACFISVSIVSLGDAKTPEECQGLRGVEFGLCVAYCQGEECDINPDTAECEDLRTNHERITGNLWFPCDIIACAQCGDPDPCNQQGTLGVCQQVPAFECVEPALAVGQYPCDVVTIPADVAPGGSQIPPQWGLIPDCQYTGPAFVCNLFIGGVLVDKCPAPPTCLTGCSSDDDCYNETGDGNHFICVDGTCAPVPDSCVDDDDCQSCVCVADICVTPPGSCEVDPDCGTVKLCVADECRDCREDADCAGVCIDNDCKGCRVDADCPEGKLCKTSDNSCRNCLSDADCAEGQECRPNGNCRDLPPAT